MKKPRYCPDCISEMKREKRKLGKKSNWYRCISCGLVEEYLPPHVEAQKEQGMINIEKQNRNGEIKNYGDGEFFAEL